MTKISLTKSPNHKDGVFNCFDNLKADLEKKLEKLSEIVIKINFVVTERELATTPIEAVAEFISFIKPFYKGRIVIAEEATEGNTEEAFRKYGFTEIAKKDSQISLLNLKNDETIKAELYYPQGKLVLPLSKKMVETDFLVSITRPKTHDSVVVTLGIKNVLVGAIQGGLMARKHIHQGMAVHHVLAEIANFVYPDFVLLDGTVGMEGNGPCWGTMKKAGFTVASFDALGADSLATYLMGFNIEDVGYLNLLKDRNFGSLYPQDEIEIVGERPENLRNPFQPHETFERQKNWK